MGKYSNIEWTTHTWNPWRGCHKISTGCKNCYMFREQERYGKDPNVVVGAAMNTFTAPRRWKEPAYVFTCSYSDFFIEEADKWRVLAWQIIKETPHLTYQILTKRPQNIPDRLPDDWGEGYENVWLGTSTENQDMAEERLPFLLDIPASLYFISCEPLVGEIYDIEWFLPEYDYRPTYEYYQEWQKAIGEKPQGKPIMVQTGIQWVIVGGESGPKARPMDLDWVEKLQRQCKDYNVPLFIKQLGQHWAREYGAKSTKGQDPDEWPEHLRVREMP